MDFLNWLFFYIYIQSQHWGGWRTSSVTKTCFANVQKNVIMKRGSTGIYRVYLKPSTCIQTGPWVQGGVEDLWEYVWDFAGSQIFREIASEVSIRELHHIFDINWKVHLVTSVRACSSGPGAFSTQWSWCMKRRFTHCRMTSWCRFLKALVGPCEKVMHD